MHNTGQKKLVLGQNGHRTEIRFASRLSARAVVGGIFSIFAVFLFLMTLCAAMGWWNFRVDGLQNLGTGFLVTTLACWIVSVSVGAYVSAIASYSTTKRDGLLNGFIAWAGACSIGCALGFLAIAIPAVVPMQPLTRGAFWALFVGDGLAILAALFGGWSGAKSESWVQSQISIERPELEISTGLRRDSNNEDNNERGLL